MVVESSNGAVIQAYRKDVSVARLARVAVEDALPPHTRVVLIAQFEREPLDLVDPQGLLRLQAGQDLPARSTTGIEVRRVVSDL